MINENDIIKFVFDEIDRFEKEPGYVYVVNKKKKKLVEDIVEFFTDNGATLTDECKEDLKNPSAVCKLEFTSIIFDVYKKENIEKFANLISQVSLFSIDSTVEEYAIISVNISDVYTRMKAEVN